jgi:hypothetical protein
VASLRFTVNTRRISADVPPDTPLLWVLRDTPGLTGTTYGCGQDGSEQRYTRLPGMEVRIVPITQPATGTGEPSAFLPSRRQLPMRRSRPRRNGSANYRSICGIEDISVDPGADRGGYSRTFR